MPKKVKVVTCSKASGFRLINRKIMDSRQYHPHNFDVRRKLIKKPRSIFSSHCKAAGWAAAGAQSCMSCGTVQESASNLGVA